jgi:tRNA threonylcarbamoyl adenosine modification protein YeaZ
VLLLAVDTSSVQVSVAVADVRADDDVRALAVRDVVAANRHGELLAPSVHDAMAAAGISAGDLDAVAAGLGPGPFTGLRVGIVTAAAMADALGLPTYGACSLDAIALRHPTPVLVCSDARRKQVYWARYGDDGRRVEGPELATAADLAERCRGVVGRVAGGGALLYREAWNGYELREDAPYPHAIDVARLVAARVVAGAAADVLEPMYLRRPDAVVPGAPKAVTPA